MKRGILIALLSAAVGGLTAYAVVNAMTKSQVRVVETSEGAQFRTVNLSQDNWPDFTYAAESAVDAVVYVKVVSTQTQQQAPSSIFDFFFGFPEGGMGMPQQRERVGSGSGVIIREDGYIVTNNHVIDGATRIEVTLNNNQTYPATLVGTDPATDVALLKVEATGLPVIPFGDSDKLRLGEWVIAIGSPYDLRSTITAGIVSAKGRSMPSNGEFKIESFIQTDAAINPGNSGGALVDMDGNLIGINAAIASRTGSYEGYSFAIPSNIVKKVVEDFLQYGSLQRAYLGVSIAEITEELAEAKGIEEMSGVYILGVDERGGAKAAGIKEDDILLSVNNISVNSNSQLIGVISQYRPGDKVTVKIQRKGDILVKEVTLKNLEGTEEMHKDSDSFYNEVLGIKAQALSSSLKSELGINHGLKIVEVKDGIFKQKGITDDFIILSVNYQKVSSEQDLNKALSNDRNGKIRIEGINSTGTYNITFEFYR